MGRAGAAGGGAGMVTLVRKPLAQIVTFWRPGSHDWTWAEEYVDLIDSDVTARIRDRIERDGFGFADDTSPVTLGPDGRVWDGHHRIVLAIEDGAHDLMVDEVAR